MTDLLECRKEIDVIDKEILRLFEKRMKVCEDVAEYKIHTGKKVLDPKREQDKIEVLKESAHGEFNELGAQELFQQIMAISRKRQYQLLTKNGVENDTKDYKMVDALPMTGVNVVFQGVEGDGRTLKKGGIPPDFRCSGNLLPSSSLLAAVSIMEPGRRNGS